MESFSFTDFKDFETQASNSIHFTNLETDFTNSRIEKNQKDNISNQLTLRFNQNPQQNGSMNHSHFESASQSSIYVESIHSYQQCLSKMFDLVDDLIGHFFEQTGKVSDWKQYKNHIHTVMNEPDQLKSVLDSMIESIREKFNVNNHKSKIMLHHFHFVKSLYDYYYDDTDMNQILIGKKEKDQNSDLCDIFEKSNAYFVRNNPLIKLMSEHLLYGEPIEACCMNLKQMDIQILDNKGHKKSINMKPDCKSKNNTNKKNLKSQIKSNKIYKEVNQDKLLRPFLSGVTFNPVYIVLDYLPDNKKVKNTDAILCHIEELNTTKPFMDDQHDVNHTIRDENTMFVSNPSKNVKYFIDQSKYNDQSYFCNKKFIQEYDRVKFILPFDQLTKCHRVPQTPFKFYDLKELSTNYVHTVIDNKKNNGCDFRLYDRRFKLNMETINKLFSKNNKKELHFIDSNFESYGFMQEFFKIITDKKTVRSFTDNEFLNCVQKAKQFEYDDLQQTINEYLAENEQKYKCVDFTNVNAQNIVPINNVDSQDHDIWLKHASKKQLSLLNIHIATHNLNCHVIKSKKKNDDVQLRMKRCEVDKTVNVLRKLGFSIDTNINHYRKLVIEYVKPDELYSMAKKIVKCEQVEYEQQLQANEDSIEDGVENSTTTFKDYLFKKYYNEPLKSSIINVLYDNGKIEYEEYKHYERIMYFKGPSLSISQREQIMDLFFWVHLSDYFFDSKSGEINKIQDESIKKSYISTYEQCKQYRIIFEYVLYQYKLNGVRVRCINSYERTGENRGRNAKKRIRLFREERAYIYDQKNSKHVGMTKEGIVIACKKKIDHGNKEVSLLKYVKKKSSQNDKKKEKDEFSKKNNQSIPDNIIHLNTSQYLETNNDIDFDENCIKKLKVSGEESIKFFEDKNVTTIKNESLSDSLDLSIENESIQNDEHDMNDFDIDLQDEINQCQRNENKIELNQEQQDMDFIYRENDEDDSDEDMNVLEKSVVQMRTILFNKREFYESQINILESLKSYFRMGHVYFQNITSKTKNFKSKIEKIANKLKNLTEKAQIENYDMSQDKKQIMEDLKFVSDIQNIVDQNFNKNSS